MLALKYDYTSLFILIPIFLSAFIHLWNPIGFLHPEHDEGIYTQRTLRLLEEIDLRDRMFGYDHPYFGPLLLAGALGITGYPDSTSPKIGDLHSIEILWTIPRVFMGLLAIIDTFLIYKIAELRYSKNVGLIASIFFAVMPITWFLRMIWLDSIQLPFLLGSILFALYLKKNKPSKSNKNKNITLVLLSGIFLGLAIFTKIPAFTTIPLIGLLIFTSSNNKRNWRALSVWFIPIILIPLIWPAYAVSVGQLDGWIKGINYQTHRTGGSFFADIVRNFEIDPLLLIIGAAGMVYAAIKRDSFLLLWTFPYSIFLYFIGFTQYFHFILIFPAFCIAAAQMITDLPEKMKNIRLKKLLPFVIVSAVGFFGLINSITMITQNDALPYFKAEAFLTEFLKDNNTETATVISNPFYLWIPQNVFHLKHEYYGFLGLREVNTKNLIIIADDDFRDLISVDDNYGHRLQKIYKSYDKKELASFADAKIFLSNVLFPSAQTRQLNLIDKTHTWSHFNNAVLNQENDTLTIKVDTNNGREKNNGASLPIHLNNTSSDPPFLTLDYFPKSIKGNAKFIVDIMDSTKSEVLWRKSLSNPDGHSKIRTFFLPTDISNIPVELRLRIVPQGTGEHILTIKNIRIT
jgi:hypothetical protein